MRTLLVGSNVESLGFQFALILAGALVVTYAFALVISREHVVIQSHFWISLEAVVATSLCLVSYRVRRQLSWNYWVVLLVTGFVVNIVLLAIDRGGEMSDIRRGRSLLDLRPRRGLYRADCNMIRNGAVATLILLEGVE